MSGFALDQDRLKVAAIAAVDVSPEYMAGTTQVSEGPRGRRGTGQYEAFKPLGLWQVTGGTATHATARRPI